MPNQIRCSRPKHISFFSASTATQNDSSQVDIRKFWLPNNDDNIANNKFIFAANKFIFAFGDQKK